MSHLKYWLGISTFLVASLVCLMASSLAVAAIDQESRLSHAKELLGKSYKKSAVRLSEKKVDLSQFLTETTRHFLPKAYKSQAPKIAKALENEANKYELDPIFLMAVIQNESSFNPTKKGSFGEIGLMQIKPKTAEWLAKEYKLSYKNEKTLSDPVSNIKLGAAFVDKLRTQFDSESRLYLSAYNIGAKKVRFLVSKNKTPKEYVIAVMKRYLAIYAAYNTNGDYKDKSLAAWNKVKDVTRKIASSKIVSTAKDVGTKVVDATAIN
jgi:soluble lytic murein transglycosylase